MQFVLATMFEKLLGLREGFLGQSGDYRLDFNPKWPNTPLINAGSANWVIGAVALVAVIVLARTRVRDTTLRIVSRIIQVVGIALIFTLISGTVAWNITLACLMSAILLYVYHNEARSLFARVLLGFLRAALVAFVLFLLNGPILTLTQTRTEPSVLAVLIDDSVSMRIMDVTENAGPNSPTRMAAAIDLLTGQDQALIKELAKKHQLRFYKFDKDAQPLGVGAGGVTATADKAGTTRPTTRPDAKKPANGDIVIDPAIVNAIESLKPDGQSTQVLRSVMAVLDDLQGQRLAGILLISDGRDSPAPSSPDLYKSLQNFGVQVYPVAVGSDRAPLNVDLQSLAVQDSAFKDDIVSVKMNVKGAGLEAGHPIKITLKDEKTGRFLRNADGSPAEKIVRITGDGNPQEEEILFKPDQEGPLRIVAEAEKVAGELNPDDNVRHADMDILDAKISVLFVDGYPRWDYRYLKNEMIRDKTVLISCLLTSADPSFAQEGDPATDKFPGPIKRFPESIEELMAYDVVIFGDVDPRQFTDSQLQLISDFVSKKGGGFGMVAGTKWSPSAFKNTALDAVLPVNISKTEPDSGEGVITEGWRPALTKEGQSSSIFRFLPDPKENEKFLRDDWQPVFWYCQGITTKPGVGEVYAEHPSTVGADGRKAPILVMGRFGAGRTLFSAIDDSWRWRFYTGENIFDTYWIQQLRYLARSKKLGQKHLTFVLDRTVYDLGDQVKLTLRILDPVLLQQLPSEIVVEIRDDKTGQLVRQERLTRTEGQSETYEGGFTADKLGSFRVKLPPFTGEAAGQDLTYDVQVPGLELSQPQVDRQLVSRIAHDTNGQVVSFAEARTKLPQIIQSREKVMPVPTSEALWDAPLAMWIFVLLITSEWVLRKAYGLL